MTSKELALTVEKNGGQRISDRVYLERIMDERSKLIDAQFALVQQRFAATAEALVHAEKVTDAKYHSLNELRKQVVDDRELLVRDDIYKEKTKFYDTWIAQVNHSLTKLETRPVVLQDSPWVVSVDKAITEMRTRSVIYTSMVGVVFLIINMFLHFVKT